MNEEVLAQNYLTQYLGEDSTMSTLVNSVWLRSVPADELDPYVKIDRLDADDVMVINLHRVWADLTFLVRGITKVRDRGSVDWTDVGGIADRIDSLLHDHEDLTSTLEMHSFREESFTDETIEGGNLWLHAGGIYRVRARAV
jgi:hypothetical protein